MNNQNLRPSKPYFSRLNNAAAQLLVTRLQKVCRFVCILLGALMLLPAFAFTPKVYRDSWSNSDRYWTVNYNIDEGAIHVKVLVYDNAYGPANEDGYVEYGQLQYSLDGGSNYTQFFNVDLNSGGGTDGTTGPRNGANVSYTPSTDGRNTWWDIRLNVDNNTRNISKIKFTAGRWEVNGAYEYDNIDATKDVSIPKMSPLSFRSYNGVNYNFVPEKENGVNVARAQISYVTSLNDVDRLSKVQLFNSNGTAASPEYTPGINPPAFLVRNSATDSNYYIKQSAYGGRFNIQTGLVNVPAFTHPKAARATYDATQQKVTFNWTIDPVSTTNVLTDRFKVQIADNKEFNDAREISIDYDKTKSSYDYPITSGLQPQYFFRVARARTGFAWELEKRADVAVTFNALPSTKLKAALQADNTALLTWDPLASAWLPGSNLVITRINTTAKTQTEIKLNKADFDKGSYVDQQIAFCNSYSYTLQVVPPVNTGFTAYAPIQVPGAILPTEIGTLKNLDVSKGYFPDRTELRWSTTGAFDNFIVKRAVYGTSNFVQLTTVPGSTNSDYQTDDNKGTPGVYYTYQVIGVVKCNNTNVFSRETLAGVGFRSPTGNIYGRITYENGQAVEDVSVRLQSNDQTQLGKSILLNGNTGSFLKVDSTNLPFSDSAFTVEAWIKPSVTNPVDQYIFQRRNQYTLGFDASGRLFFSYKGASVYGTYTNTSNSFVHVAGIHTRDSLLIMLNNAVVGRLAVPYSSAVSVEKTVYIGRGFTGQLFKGFIDEMRVFNIALTPDQINQNQNRLFVGDEKGLAAYWRFDETISDQFYDLSFQGENYNRNDGNMLAANVSRSATIPTADQLSLKSFTDKSGNYFISGIPYIGNGTTYTVVPLKGTHQFDPISVTRLISPSSTQFNVDFKDKSSFPVSGYVYYKNTTVPVPAVQFRVDGQLAQKTNGAIIETDETGKFEISVPVGTHEVRAVKADHIFENGGKITDRDGFNLNYQNNLSGLELSDSTTIRFIGRVAGGAIQQRYPLGHSLSANNLGKNISIKLELSTGTKFQLNKTGTSSKTVNHFLPSNVKDSSKIHRTRNIYNENSIEIRPDSITGEFAIDLIPAKFIVKQVDVTGWGDLLDGKPVLLDFTNSFTTGSSVRRYEDSARNSAGDYVKTKYYDSLTFNASYQFIKRKDPIVEVNQVDGSGKAMAYFGNSNFKTNSLLGVQTDVTLVNNNAQGRSQYLFNYPAFVQNQNYQFAIKASEQYPYYENVLPDGTAVVKRTNNKDVIDVVPTSDGEISINNRIKNGAVLADVLNLDSTGRSIYEFIAGDPNIAASGIKTLSVSVKFGPSTIINWNWMGEAQLSALVLGSKLTGTDFVTAGPNKMLMVLRDPPGSKGYSYVEKGSVITNRTTYTGSLDQVGEESLMKIAGGEVVTFSGIGSGTITATEVANGLTVGVRHEEHYVGTKTVETSDVLTTRFQTSDDSHLVGAPADVFVGYSTNISYGQSNNITIIPRNDLKATDLKIYEPSATSPYILVQRSGISIGQIFSTLFAFPQQHIEKVLIPNLIKIRNTVLNPRTMSESAAVALANSSKKPVYVSKLDITDPNFGKSNRDTIAFGASAKIADFGDGRSYRIYFPTDDLYRTDTVMILNQYISSWKSQMAENERIKLESTLRQNYSFHGGSPIEYSAETAVSRDSSSAFNIIISGAVQNSTDVKINGAGLEFSFREEIGTSQGGDFGGNKTGSQKFGFVLSSEGLDDYFSVDVNIASDSSFVFRTKGGVSGCPYQGQTVTQYYQKGTVLDQPTQRIEVPVLAVEKPVVTDIPSQRKASYSLLLRNESEAKLPATFVLGYTDNDSIKGATISVDGTPIGGAGREIVVPYGETITKILTLTRGPEAMDYNNIQILLHSACQYVLTGYNENIADTVLISAHFIPSCSDINIKSPKDKFVLNSESPVNSEGKRYLPITIDQFDVNNSLFDHIELQYKPTASGTWIGATKFYFSKERFDAAQGQKVMITNAEAINYNFVLDDASFNDQTYDIQAVSYCKVGAAFLTTESNLITGIKDTYNPRLFGTPQPADGILSVNDDVRLNFNETIAAGLLTNSDFQVTGIRNGVKGDHSVSVRLNGATDFLATEFDKNFTGKNITAEMWILPAKQNNETIFSQGNLNEAMELSLTADDRLQIIVGSKVIKSDKTFVYKAGEWAHVAMVYNANSQTVSAFYNFEELIHAAPATGYGATGHVEYGRSISKQGNFFTGKMHEARIWSDTLNSIRLQMNSLRMLSGAETNLLAYYPMNEGKGRLSFDKAHGSNATLTGLWSTPAGKAVTLNGNGYVKMNTAYAPVVSAMDYTIELWFRGDASQKNATLASNGKGDGEEFGGSLNLFNLGFENGLLTYRNNASKTQADGNFLDNKWHHVALAVNRSSGNAQLFVDGALNQFFDAQNLGGIVAADAYLGARRWYAKEATTVPIIDNYFTGQIDEFRIWNTYLNQTLIAANNNVRLQGNELGLMTYYPFEIYESFQGNTSLYYSLKDARVQEVAGTVVPPATVVNAVETSEAAPMKDRGPVENLKFDFVVNNDALILNVQEPKQSIDKTVITFKSKNVRDMNGNKVLSPITWTAFIDQNQVKWSDNELALTKDVYAPLQFESRLVNNGGSEQHFTLSNLPSWLKASPSSGTVAPKGNVRISFTVNEALNIGSYQEIVFMRNDNNENEALKVNLQVRGKKPDWVVKTSDYQYNMAVYAKLRVNNIFSVNREDMLAAFVNGVCVGVASNTYSQQNDFWYAFLTINSNAVSANNLEFRIWQASTGKVFGAIPARTINFANDAIIGTIANPVVFDGSAALFQDIVLNQNWNWVSFNLAIPAQATLNTTLAGGNWTSEDIVKNDNLGFSNYTNNRGWVGSLNSLTNTTMYKVKATNAQAVSVSGTAVNVTTIAIPLKGARWNYISYLPQVNMTIKEALAGYKAMDEDVIKSQTGFAMYSKQNGWIGSLTYLEPGKGYMLYRNGANDTVFYYPRNNGSLTGRFAQEVNPNANERPVTANFRNAENMTIAAVLADDFKLQTGDSLVAMVGGEIRGKAVAVRNPENTGLTYFFNIGGDTEQPLVFLVQRGREIIAQSVAAVNYRSNTTLGSLHKPFELRFDQQQFLTNIFPNPFKAATNVVVDLRKFASSGNHEIQISILDVSGRLVLTKAKQIVSGSEYRFTWNGKKIDGSDCGNGIYFIHVTIDNVSNIYQVLKQ